MDIIEIRNTDHYYGCLCLRQKDNGQWQWCNKEDKDMIGVLGEHYPEDWEWHDIPGSLARELLRYNDGPKRFKFPYIVEIYKENRWWVLGDVEAHDEKEALEIYFEKTPAAINVVEKTEPENAVYAVNGNPVRAKMECPF